jgi:NTP pyrophosphatase (non-canonical NTP hydrolase)
MNEIEILCAAIRAYGEKAQEEVAIEECAELIQAISHKHRGREHNISEEIADVEIMLEQLKIINNCASEVEYIKQQKINRLYNKVFDKCL